LQYVAGHDTIKTTMRYVCPQANAVQKLFARLATLEHWKPAAKRSMQKVVGKMNTPGRPSQSLSRYAIENK
jgi:hypothetical protein